MISKTKLAPVKICCMLASSVSIFPLDLLASRSGVEGNLPMRGGGSSIETHILVEHVGIPYLYCPTLLSDLDKNWFLGLSSPMEKEN